jgi:hypothetical protein
MDYSTFYMGWRKSKFILLLGIFAGFLLPMQFNKLTGQTVVGNWKR